MPACFEFATAAQIIFGAGKLKELGPIAASLGRKALVTTGFRGAGLEQLTGILRCERH